MALHGNNALIWLESSPQNIIQQKIYEIGSVGIENLRFNPLEHCDSMKYFIISLEVISTCY